METGLSYCQTTHHAVRNSLLCVWFCVLAAHLPVAVLGQADYSTPFTFTTLAGNAGYGSADGTGSAARFNSPSGVAVDSTDNVYVADSANHTIRKVTPAGGVTTLAGLAGGAGTADGTGSAARLYDPGGVAVDSAGNVYVADSGNNTIRKGTPVANSRAALRGSVTARDAQGRSLGPLAGATVTVASVGTSSTDASGEFSFSSVNPGTVSVAASKAGYYTVTRSVTLAAGQTRYETFQLSAQSVSGPPQAYDVASPNGKHFIRGMPGSLSFGVTVAWNGSAGSVYFNVAGTRYPAQVADLGGGLARATLTIAAPSSISACSELTVDVTNAQGQRAHANTGIHFYPVPGIIVPWYRDNIP